jgi:asparagine synthase (glutamine-hydrolysing)
MCGISGIIGKEKVNLDLIRQINEVIEHRGPDGKGIWSNNSGNVAFGHVRLSILDLSSQAAQPMANKKGNIHITFNGEIYNFIELRDSLKGKGYYFNTDSDTEVLLYAYEEWGFEMLEKINGMFAFCIFDELQNHIFCARDRYGEKPFLYSFSEDFFIFSSEYKGILQAKEVSSKIDEKKLMRFALNQGTGLDEFEETLFNEIRQLLPGTSLKLDLNDWKLVKWKYWDIEINSNLFKGSFKDASFEFGELLLDSIKLRMRSDVEVGSCLSGGLDSSAIVSLIRKKISPIKPYHTFSGIFPDSDANEWEFAKQIVDDCNTISHVIEPTSKDLVNSIEEFIWYNELPVGSTSQFAQWSVFKLARANGIKVLLDGQGSDEILGGYEQYFYKYLQGVKISKSNEVYLNEIKKIDENYPGLLESQPNRFIDKIPFRLRYLLANKLGKGSSSNFGLNYDLAIELQAESGYPNYNFKDPLKNALYGDSFNRFLSTLLRYGDRNSMAHSVEIRLPFCDHRIAEFILTLPTEFIMGDGKTKRILRESMNGVLIDPIRLRMRKRGFLPPQNKWFNESLLLIAEDIFNSKQFKENICWNADWWISSINRIKNGDTNLNWSIWNPLIIELWRKYFLDKIDNTNKKSIFLKGN